MEQEHKRSREEEERLYREVSSQIQVNLLPLLFLLLLLLFLLFASEELLIP